MGQLRVMGSEGDMKVIWNAEKLEEVRAARETFERLKAKKYIAYAVKKDGEKGYIISSFDPGAEKIIMAAPMAGG